MADDSHATLNNPGQEGYDAGKTYVDASSVKPPTLAVADGYREPLSLTGFNYITAGDPAGGSGDEPPSEPSSSPFSVVPSDIKDLEKTLMDMLATQVDEYEAFRKLILNTEGWIFLVQKPGDMYTSGTNYTGVTDANGDVPPNAFDDDGGGFEDPDPASTQNIVDSQNRLVGQLAASLKLMGAYVAQLNNAAQTYVHADRAAYGTGQNASDFLDDRPTHLPPGINIK